MTLIQQIPQDRYFHPPFQFSITSIANALSFLTTVKILSIRKRQTKTKPYQRKKNFLHTYLFPSKEKNPFHRGIFFTDTEYLAK